MTNVTKGITKALISCHSEDVAGERESIVKRSAIAAAVLVAAPLIVILPTSPAAAAEASCAAISSAPETDVLTRTLDYENGAGALIGRTRVYRSAGYVIGGVTLYDFCVQTKAGSAAYGSYTTRPARSVVYTYRADGSRASADSGVCSITYEQQCSVLIQGQRAMRRAYGRVTANNGTSYSESFEYTPPASFPNSGAPCNSLADPTLKPFAGALRSVNLVTTSGLTVGKVSLYRSAGYWESGRTVYDYCAVTNTKVEAYGGYTHEESSVAAQAQVTTALAPDLLSYGDNSCDLATVMVECAVAKKGQTEYPNQFDGSVRVGGVDVGAQVDFSLGQVTSTR